MTFLNNLFGKKQPATTSQTKKAAQVKMLIAQLGPSEIKRKADGGNVFRSDEKTIDQLRILGDPTAIPALQAKEKELGEFLDFLRTTFSAGGPLAGIGLHNDTAQYVRGLREKTRVVISELQRVADGQGGRERVDRLIGDLNSKDPKVQLMAADNIKKMGKEAVDPLIATLQDTNADMRSWAASLLKSIPDGRAVAPLIAALSDNDARVCKNAIQALGQLQNSRAIDPLLLSLVNADPNIRSEAAYALASFGTANVKDALLGALSDEAPNVRMGAAQSLGILKEPRAIEPLSRLQHEEIDTYKREVFSKALTALGNSTPKTSDEGRDVTFVILCPLCHYKTNATVKMNWGGQILSGSDTDHEFRCLNCNRIFKVSKASLKPYTDRFV